MNRRSAIVTLLDVAYLREVLPWVVDANVRHAERLAIVALGHDD